MGPGSRVNILWVMGRPRLGGRNRCCLTGLPKSPEGEEFSLQEIEGGGEKTTRRGVLLAV